MVDLHIKPVITSQDNYYWLLMALMILFFCSALFEQLGEHDLRQLMGVMLTGVILISVWSVEHRRVSFLPPSAVTVMLVAVMAGEYFFEHYNLALLQLVSLLLFTVLSISISCRQVLFSGHVDANNIVGAICIYLLLGLAWALAYLLVDYFFPGSVPGLEGEHWHRSMQKAVYFSFVTLTTLGYGDVSPVQPLARYLCFMQAVTGQFYIAILVASLIGVRMASRQQE